MSRTFINLCAGLVGAALGTASLWIAYLCDDWIRENIPVWWPPLVVGVIVCGFGVFVAVRMLLMIRRRS